MRKPKSHKRTGSLEIREMLDEKAVKRLVVSRLQACSESCNSHHINHVCGQIRALTAVLRDGVPIGAHVRDATEVLDYCDIPYISNGNEYEVDAEYEHDLEDW